ncbi:Leucine--tRNA ligase [bacterium HR36]|nr:Leucine--tRNA ligase [bacterium HR36]
MRFNTAIAAMMELANYLGRLTVRPKSVLETFVLLLSPFAPHIAEELWQALGHSETLAYHSWPEFDPNLIKVEEIEIPVQVNGKVRTRITVPVDADEDTVKQAALADPRVQDWIAGKTVRKTILVPNKLINLVVA